MEHFPPTAAPARRSPAGGWIVPACWAVLAWVGSAAPTNGPWRAVAAEPDAVPSESQATAPGLDDPRVGVERLKQLRVADLHLEQGEFEQAITTYREVYGSLKKILPEDHVLLLWILDRVSDIRVSEGRAAEAEGPLTKVIALRHPDGDVAEKARLAADLLKLGRIHAMTGKPEAASEPIQRGHRLLEDLLGSDHDLVGLAAELLAEAAADEGRYAEAAAVLRARAEIASRTRGPATSDTLRWRDRLAGMLLAAGRFPEAIDVWAESFAADAAASRSRTPGSLDRLRWLAVAHACNGDAEEAARVAKRCLRVSAALSGGDAADRACDAALLALCLELDGRSDEAAAHFKGFLEAARGAESEPPRPHRCEQLRMLVGPLLERGLIDRAVELGRALLACDERRSDPSAVAVTDDQVAIASCLFAGGDMAAAETLLRQAIVNYRKLLGDGHAKTIAAVVLLGRSAAARSDFGAAADAVDAVIRRRPPATNPRREADMAELVGDAAALLERAGEAERAAALREDWLAQRGGKGQDMSPAAADVLVAYANSLDAAGEPGRALPLYDRAVKMREKLFGRRHPTVAAVLLPIARNHRQAGRFAEARRAAEECLQIWKDTIGADHEVTIETLLTLASAAAAAGDQRAAVPLYERAREGLERRLGPADARVGRVLADLAQAKAATGDAAGARTILERAIDIQATAETAPRTGSAASVPAASESLERARELAMLGDSAVTNTDVIEGLGTLGRTAAVPDKGDEKIAAATRTSGAADDRGTAADLLDVAKRMQRNGNRNAARVAVEQALADARRKHGGDHPRVAEILVALGDLLQESDDFAAAFEAYQQALDIQVAAHGESHVDSIIVALKLAAPLQVSGGRDTARTLIDLAVSRIPDAIDDRVRDRLAIALRSSADYTLAVADHPTAAALLERLAALESRSGAPAPATTADLATAYERSGQAAKAVPLRQKLVEAARAAGGTAVARRLVDLAWASMRAGKPQDAEPRLRQAIAEDEKEFGASHPRVAAGRLDLATVMEALNRPQDAAAAANSARPIVAGITAAPAAGDTESLRLLAASLRRRGDLVAAGRVIQVALDHDMNRRGRGHRETAEDHRELALVRRLEGDLAKAEKNYDRLVSILTSTHGPGDHRTVAVRFELADMLEHGNRGLDRDGSVIAAERRSGSSEKPASTANAFKQVLAAVAASRQAARDPDAAEVTGTTDAGDKARAMLDAAKGLYGVSDRGEGAAAGAKKGGLDALVLYAETLESLATTGDAAAGERPRAEDRTGGSPAVAPAAKGERPDAAGTMRLAQAASALAAPPPSRSAAAGRPVADTPVTARPLLSQAWQRHFANEPRESDRLFAAALEAAEKPAGGPTPAAVGPEEVLEQHAAALIERGDLEQARRRLEDLLQRRARSLPPQDPRVAAVEAALTDVLIGLGDYRAAWPFAAAGVRMTRAVDFRSSLEHAEADIRLATLEAAIGRNGLAAERLQSAGSTLAALFAQVGKAGADRQAAEDFKASDRRLFRAAVAFARAALARGDAARAETALAKTLKTGPLVAAAAPADLDAGLTVLAIAAAAVNDRNLARWSSGRLHAARERRFGPRDLRTLTAAACKVAFDGEQSLQEAGSPPNATGTPDARERLRELVTGWLKTDPPPSAHALSADVLALIPTITAVLRRGDATDVALAAAVRDHGLEMARDLEVPASPAILLLAEAAAIDDPGPESAARVAAVRGAFTPLVRPLAGAAAADRRILQAAMLDALGDRAWPASLWLEAARETAELANRRQRAERPDAERAAGAMGTPATARRSPFRAAPARTAPPAAGEADRASAVPDATAG